LILVTLSVPCLSLATPGAAVSDDTDLERLLSGGFTGKNRVVLVALGVRVG